MVRAIFMGTIPANQATGKRLMGTLNQPRGDGDDFA